MSTATEPKSEGRLQETERIQAGPGPGRGPFGGGMVGQKASTFKPSARRLVAQRVSTIRDADLILVVEDGQVVGRGTHEDLLADCGTYQEIVTSQLSAEEAAA